MEQNYSLSLVSPVRSDQSVLKIRFTRVPAWLVFSEYDDWNRFFHELFQHRRLSLPSYVPKSSLVVLARQSIVGVTGNRRREEWQIAYKSEFMSTTQIIEFFRDLGFVVTIQKDL